MRSRGYHRFSLEFSLDIDTPDDPENELREVHVEADVKVSNYDPGCTSGPPESCYPPEGGEVEIESVAIDGVETPEVGWPKGLADVIEQKAFEMSQEYDDSLDDDWR